MKLVCHKTVLAEIINTVQKAVSSKAVMPILECIKLDAYNDGKITVTANNLDLCIEYYCDCTVTDGGSIALSSRMFGDIIRRLPDEDVEIEVNPSNNVTTIKGGKSEFNIQGLNALEYPAVPEVSEVYRFSMKQGVLKNMIKKTIFAVSQNESKRPILTGSLFEIESGVLSVVSTDNYRLAIINEVVDSSLQPISFVVPGFTLREVLKVLKDGEENVDIIVSDRYAMFDFGEFNVTTRLLEGKYINYRPVLQTPNAIYVNALARDLADSLERAALIINDDMSAKAEKLPVILNISSDKIEITCMTSRSKVYDAIEVSASGDDLEIGFNHKLLLDALRACENDEIKMEFSNPRSSCFIRSKNDDSYTFMILPVRLYNN
ncbi:MAG: DNA polymerase III subunit beta [Eubacteriales bacterium]|nr:DNA polymerase III subunit beta [Eubacteriales bacterium]